MRSVMQRRNRSDLGNSNSLFFMATAVILVDSFQNFLILPCEDNWIGQNSNSECWFFCPLCISVVDNLRNYRAKRLNWSFSTWANNKKNLWGFKKKKAKFPFLLPISTGQWVSLQDVSALTPCTALLPCFCSAAVCNAQLGKIGFVPIWEPGSKPAQTCSHPLLPPKQGFRREKPTSSPMVT